MRYNVKSIPVYMIALLVVGLFHSCQEAPKSQEKVMEEPQEQGAEDAQSSLTSHTTVNSVQPLTEVDRKELPFNGRFLSAQSWNDRLGQNTVILSEKGEYDDGEGRKELFAYHYVKGDTAHEVLWQMNDFVDGEGCDLDIQLINLFPLISDVDSNGVAETAIFYSLNARCDASTFPAKLIVYEGESKFAIRGVRAQYLGPPEEVINTYRAEQNLPPIKYKNLDTSSSKMDSSIVNYYAAQWDKFIALENESNGRLPDGLETRIK